MSDDCKSIDDVCMNCNSGSNHWYCPKCYAQLIENKSMLLREYEIWLFQTGKIRAVDLDWHKEFLTQKKEGKGK